MKNFQQTPKSRRVSMAKNKAALSSSKPACFQPREAWSTKRALGGVPASVLENKQMYVVEQDYYASPFSRMTREEQRLHERVHKQDSGDNPPPQLHW